MEAKAGTETETEWLNSGVPGCGFLCCVSLLPPQRVVSNIVNNCSRGMELSYIAILEA